MSAEHILVVEDTKLIRNVLRSRLEAEGYQVTPAGKISEALVAIRTKMPDLLILDLTLDGEDPFSTLTDGFAFLTLLRRNYPKADVAVIIYSVNYSPEVESRAKSMGATAVIDKKSGIVALLSAVGAALEERRSKQAAAPAVDPA